MCFMSGFLEKLEIRYDTLTFFFLLYFTLCYFDNVMICIIVIVNNVFKILLRVVSLFTVNYLKFKLLFSVLLNLSIIDDFSSFCVL